MKAEFNKLSKEILNDMKPQFPLLKEVIIRQFQPTYIEYVFSFDWSLMFSAIVRYITETYGLEYCYKESNPISCEDNFVFHLNI